MKYRVKTREKNICVWTPWTTYAPSDFNNRKSVKEYFESLYRELNQKYKMWQAGSVMGDESSTFEICIFDLYGNKFKW